MLKTFFMGKKSTHFFNRGELVKNLSIFFGVCGWVLKVPLFEGSKVEVSKMWRIDFFEIDCPFIHKQKTMEHPPFWALFFYQEKFGGIFGFQLC